MATAAESTSRMLGLLPHKVDMGLVPQSYFSWIKSNPDIMDGKWSFKESTPREIEKEKQSIIEYLAGMKQKFPQYMNFLKHISIHPKNDIPEKGMAGITELGRRDISPMEPECRLSVIIPAKCEEKNIYDTLSSYAQQIDKNGNPLNPNMWEINIVVNIKEEEDHDGTYDEVLRFKKDNPHIHVNALEITLQKKWAHVGFLRKLLSDISLTRSYQRKEQKGPHYIESDDADLIWVDPHLVNTIISTFDANPGLDSLTGYQEKNLRAMAEVEHVFLSRRFWDIMTTQAFHYLRQGKVPLSDRNFEWSRPFTYGVNTAHTAQVHALIGGYDWEAKVGEDLDMGKRISLLRGGIQNGLFVPELRSLGIMRTRTNSSPRRYLWGLYKGVGHVYSESNFAKDEPRKLSQDQMIQNIPIEYRRINEDNKRFYEKELWFLYESLRKIVPTPELARKIASRTMILIGFKTGDFVITEDEIRIKNSRNFAKAMEDYRKRKPYTEG